MGREPHIPWPVHTIYQLFLIPFTPLPSQLWKTKGTYGKLLLLFPLNTRTMCFIPDSGEKWREMQRTVSSLQNQHSSLSKSKIQCFHYDCRDLAKQEETELLSKTTKVKLFGAGVRGYPVAVNQTVYRC